MLNLGVLVSGRGSNLLAIIKAIEEEKIKAKIVCVISDKEDAKGLKIAREHNIEAIFLSPLGLSKEEYDRLIVEELKKRDVSLVCLAGFMRIISPFFVSEYKNRIMNIHPSLLPSFPGLSAQKQALEYGVKVSGATVHFVDNGCDTGPIILQKAVSVLPDDTEETLSARILEEEHKIYPKAIRLFSEGRLEVSGRKVSIK
ncbi:MAG: phosphoribosylglycinamide formyltransferase [bacterium]